MSHAQTAETGPQTPTPFFEWGFSFEPQSIWIVQADDPAFEGSDTFLDARGAFGLNFTEALSAVTLLAFEPVKDRKPGEDRFFEDEGLYVERLFLNYETERFYALGGKYAPTFGTAWYLAPGIFGSDLNSNYEIREKLGGAVAFRGSNSLGDHTLTGNIFTADTSALSESIITKRGRLTRSDGGPSNSDDPSFSITLDGNKFMSVPGLFYNLGVMHQAKGRGDAGDENGVVGGLRREIETEKISYVLFGELAYLENLERTPNDALYLTLSGEAYWSNNWFGNVVFGLRDINGSDNESFEFGQQNDLLASVGFGYGFNANTALEFGYRFLREADDNSHTVAVRFSKTIGRFCQLASEQQICD